MKCNRKSMWFLIGFSLGGLLPCAILAWLPLWKASAAEAPGRERKRVLALTSVMREAPVADKHDTLYQKTLSEGFGGQLEYYSEYLDVTRFSDRAYEAALRDFLRRKYERVKFDLIITTETGLGFVGRYGSELFPGTPVVYLAFRDLHLGPNFFALVFEPPFKASLESALNLQPKTRRVYVICGASVPDKHYEVMARRQFQEFEGRVTFTYLTDMPLPDLLQTVANLPADSIIYHLLLTEDGEGNKFIPVESLEMIAAAANVPVYSFSEGSIGRGNVGGRVQSLGMGARLTAELGLRILNGERPATVSLDPKQMTVTAFDWRQLRRWGISEENLPPGSEVRFKELTFWEQYKWRIIAALCAMGMQTLLIGFLLVERNRRQRARQSLQQSEEQFRLLFENSKDAILVADDDANYLRVNDAACEALGYSREQLLRMKVVDLISAQGLDTEARYRNYFEKGFETGEWSFVRPDGERRIIQYTASRFAPGLHLSIVRDITERKRAEQSLHQSFKHIEQLKEQLQAENLYLQEEIKLNHNFDEIIGESKELKYVFHKVEQVGPADTTVLLLGETGTGKELVARAIHRSSPRKARPFIKVNCATLPASLIESELFGYEKGAFTGAHARKLGRFELANEGTLLLDEIGDLPLELQTKLLRVLQEDEFERLGGTQTIKVNVRIVAATNRNMKMELQNGLFREDLWYRLSVFPITLPPLRQRKDDIPLLVNHFVNVFRSNEQ